ncbi:hypothetical protein KVR01_013064 [Diaporthe batatas]|uniref:uncharacterized protein n=1 Tax=Diaporthe batatas TaxID=748121 RepID=UPI001D0582E8|nr:uncharacterized protein KVR01_013064 [Diaporthe batatas]KAG8157074.1 hypothetical protein KVR01_013064 [Diaporthe batatas]
MVRERKEKRAKNIKLKQPDRSGPTEKTLLDIADERNLFKQAAAKERQNKRQNGEAVDDDDDDDYDNDDDDEGLSPGAERLLETLLYSVSLAMLHLTLDVLVQQQALQALMAFTALVYALHPHAAATTVVPGLPLRLQDHARQAIFLAMGTAAGCYLIHITNKFGYIAVLKQAPPLGCLWVWSVIELRLALAVASLAASGAFFWQGGYTIS